MPFHLPKLSHVKAGHEDAESPVVSSSVPLSNDPPSYNDSISSSTSRDSLSPTVSQSNLRHAGTAPAIAKSSSSSILRAQHNEDPHHKGHRDQNDPHHRGHRDKNIPYKPSKEQQRQIDLLNRSNNSISALSATTSGAHTEYFDVLPSFQMFQSILKRDDNQFNENLSVDPPVYGDTMHSSPTPPTLSPVGSRSEEGHTIESVSQRLSEYELNNENTRRYDEDEESYLFGEDETSEETRPTHTHEDTDATTDENVSTTVHETYGHTVLDNIDRLPKSNSSPIDIQIFVAKRVPQANAFVELETRLKEYTSGDLVNGYIVITNNSDKPVDFGLFTVSLEGTIKATERDPNVNEGSHHKYKKVLIKKFLKMYDLNASYGYAHIPNSAGIEYEAFTNDLYDGCQLGLPNERVLFPHIKYKKFFTFRFPDKLLDNNCIDNLLPHNLPPPSMGLDKICFFNRGENIQLNKALGYGFLNIRGTPLLTRDYSFDDLSISYTIEAKFIDKLDADNQKDPLSQHEINDPNSDNNYVISKHNQYFLRFIPDLREQLEYFNQGYQFLTSTYGTLGVDGKLFQNYIYFKTWRELHELNQQIEREIEGRLNREELSIDDMKHKNLLLESQDFTSTTISQLDIKNSMTRQLHNNRGNSWEIDEQLEYLDRRMIGNRLPINVFGKKKKKILSSLVHIGTSRLYVQVPSKILPYSSPKLLMRYNNGTASSDGSITPTSPGPQDYDNGFHPISSIRSPQSVSSLKMSDEFQGHPINPVSSTSSVSSNSNMEALYNRSCDESLSSIDIELVFEPINNSFKPPLISSIETNVIFWSFNTEYPLPVELNYDFFYQDGKNIDVEVKQEDKTDDDNVEVTRKNLQSLKDQAQNYIQFLKANKTYISKNSYLYLKAVRSLGIRKDTIKDYFKTITSTSHAALLNEESGWKVKQLPNQKFKWVKTFSLPLVTINKNNITLLPTFQSCLVGRIYCLQIVVKYKGSGGDQNEFADNVVKVDVPILVG